MDAPHTAAAAAHKNTHTHSICGGRNATRISICSPWRRQRLQTTQLWHKQCTNTLRAIFFCCFIVVVVCAHCFAARFFTCFRITDFSSICVYSACIFFFLFCFLSRLRLDNYIGLPPMFGIVPRYTACASAALLYLRRLSASVRERVFCTANKLRAARMNACEHGGEKKKWKKNWHWQHIMTVGKRQMHFHWMSLLLSFALRIVYICMLYVIRASTCGDDIL